MEHACRCGTMILGVVEIPPEEQIQWDNPEVHFTFLADTISALRATSGIDGAALDAAEQAARALGAFKAGFGGQQ